MLGWTIEDHKSAGGDSYIRNFLEDLTNPQDRKEAAALIKVLAMRGNLLREPISQALGDWLFELRGDQVRIFIYVPAGEADRAARWSGEKTGQDSDRPGQKN